MYLTLERLQSLLADLSMLIQLFLFLLGVLLIIVPLIISFSSCQGWFSFSTLLRLPRHQGYRYLHKRICHYAHLWILVALEELGLFGLLDTLFFWLPLSEDDTTSQDDDTDEDTTSKRNRSFLSVRPSLFNRSTTMDTTAQQHSALASNPQLANVCIRHVNNNADGTAADYPLVVSGLVNTGNTCYLNSVLQVS